MISNKTNRALTHNDLVVGRTSFNQKPLIPADLESYDASALRYDGSDIVLPGNYTTFYIDSDGVKHIIQHDDLWQELECAFDDDLTTDDDGNWKVKDSNDEYNENYSSIETSRTEAYTSRVRPYLEEANIKQYQGDEEEYTRLMELAVAERVAIQEEYPWPESPEE